MPDPADVRVLNPGGQPMRSSAESTPGDPDGAERRPALRLTELAVLFSPSADDPRQDVQLSLRELLERGDPAELLAWARLQLGMDVVRRETELVRNTAALWHLVDRRSSEFSEGLNAQHVEVLERLDRIAQAMEANTAALGALVAESQAAGARARELSAQHDPSKIVQDLLSKFPGFAAAGAAGAQAGSPSDPTTGKG